MLNFMYTIIISPIIQIIEFSFVFFYKIFHNLAFSLFGVSLAVSLFSLPLYMMAERWQIIERNTVKSFKSYIGKIKSVFHGDEQFMILSAFYRQNHYHPIYALRSTLGLVIQIPFFIAAYNYLSNLEILRGVGFKFIKDLGMPDSLFQINSITINILPIAMTLINCIAGAIYTKGLSTRDKIQVYGIAFIFLILLYNTPSCLVIYWTLNNIFSLVKNIFYRIKNPLKVIYISGCIIITIFIMYLFIFMKTRVFSKRLLIACLLSIFYFLPLIKNILNYLYINILSKLLQNKKLMIYLLFASCITLFLLAGIYIPSSVIASSPEEFSFIDNYNSPFIFIFHSLFFYAGLFILWPICIYFLFPDKIKIFLITIFSTVTVIASIYTLIFSGKYGLINNIFNFITTGVLVPAFSTMLLSIIILIPVFFLIFALIKTSKTHFINALITIVFVFLFGTSFYNIVQIHKSFNDLSKRQLSNKYVNAIKPIFNLSKDNKNVIIFMADGAVNGFVPLIFNDHPELNDKFSGFTLFTNTASFSNHTLMAVPAIWGGYEFTPLEMNKRNTIPLVEKHNMALLTLPVLLEQAGFHITVTDPSWANYAWISDISIYDEYDNITAYNTERNYTQLWYTENDPESLYKTFNKIKRNIIWFSFLKISLPSLRSIIYDNGWYWDTDNIGTSITDFINSYSVLDYLPRLTEFNADTSSALLITNDITHKFGYIQPPDYTPTSIKNAIGKSKFSRNDTYHSNTALYLKIGEWFDIMKKNGTYDNTRIIIIADHGSGAWNLVSDKPIPIKGESRELYNPVFLFKDFNKKGKLAINKDFMTNADVPSIILQNIIDNPHNPFTGNPINMESKKDGIYISTCHIPMAGGHGKYRFNIKNNQWMYLRDSIFESSNWEYAKNDY